MIESEWKKNRRIFNLRSNPQVVECLKFLYNVGYEEDYITMAFDYRIVNQITVKKTHVAANPQQIALASGSCQQDACNTENNTNGNLE